ncbi:MAG: ATP-binding protein, partial [Oscillospiraceae bacterium]
IVCEKWGEVMERLISAFNYGLVLLFGVFLSVLFAGRSKKQKDCLKILLFSVFTLCLQTACSYFFGFDITTKLYPLITHLPLVLFLVLALKKPVGISIASVLTAYFCCQLPRWVGVLSYQIFKVPMAYPIAYSISIISFFFLIWRFFTKPAHQAMTYSKQSLILFGCLPAVYYVFDYAATVYTEILYTGIRTISEFLPTVMVLFYVWFIVAYHGEVQQKTQIQLEKNMLSMQMETANLQMKSLRSAQEQAIIYRHDMRHHFSMIDSFARQGETGKIIEYLENAQQELTAITPMCFCENETVNLILSSFVSKAKEKEVTLSIKAELPKELKIPNTELCSVLSNGVENALSAASKIEDSTLRKVFVDCRVNRNMLLIEIENAYIGDVKMEGQTPISTEIGHGYGCKSMRSIAQKRNGFCSFAATDGIFTLRVVLPMEKEPVTRV